MFIHILWTTTRKTPKSATAPSHQNSRLCLTVASMMIVNPVLLAPSPEVKYDAMYYLKGAAAGGICCSITHGALTPVDVVKTRVQLDSVKVSTMSTRNGLELNIPCCQPNQTKTFTSARNDTMLRII